MFRLLLILTLLFYLLYKLGLFRVFVHQVRDGYSENENRPAGGNVKIDTAPKKQRKKSDTKDGDYIDFEEVK